MAGDRSSWVLLLDQPVGRTPRGRGLTAGRILLSEGILTLLADAGWEGCIPAGRMGRVEGRVRTEAEVDRRTRVAAVVEEAGSLGTDYLCRSHVMEEGRSWSDIERSMMEVCGKAGWEVR